MKLMRNILIIVLLFSVVLISCKKEKEWVSLASKVGFAVAQSLTEADAMQICAMDVAKNRGNIAGHLIVPPTSTILFQDSLFSDGDGLEFSIDFGVLRAEKPYGLKCLDGKFRAGKLNCTLSKQYFDSATVISCKASNAFYVGNGTEMFNMIGEIVLSRINVSNWTVTQDLIIDALHLDKMYLESELTLTEAVERLTYVGIATGNAVGSEDAYSMTITKPLEKLATCSNTFVDGKCEISVNEDKVLLDFNPYNDRTSDAIARASLNSYEKIFIIH